jgi:hypothetical protein
MVPTYYRDEKRFGLGSHRIPCAGWALTRSSNETSVGYSDRLSWSCSRANKRNRESTRVTANFRPATGERAALDEDIWQYRNQRRGEQYAERVFGHHR